MTNQFPNFVSFIFQMEGVTFKGIFKGKQSIFEEKIYVDSGLLSKLEEYRIITNTQRTELCVIYVTVCKIY